MEDRDFCRHCNAPVVGSYARARICVACQRDRRRGASKIEAILDKGHVVEAWRAEDGTRKYVCLVSTGRQDKQFHGEGRSLLDAIKDAINRMEEADA